MAKSRLIFLCSSCEARFPKWMGRCPECEAWNTVAEDLSAHGPEVVALPRRGQGAPIQALPLNEAEHPAGDSRLGTGLSEADRVLGGGLPVGSVSLLGGDPGIGKSTLALQVLSHVVGRGEGGLYVSGEESAAQVKARAERLGLEAGAIQLLATVELETVAAEIERLSPRLVVVDSIQTLRTQALDGIAGNVSQVRACADLLIRIAKRRGMAVLMVGHVTKEGQLAGPRTLEHMVDALLYLEGQMESPQRILRSVKNRFGSTREIGLFTLGERGMAEVKDPGALFLAERRKDAAGTVVFLGMEGTRVLPVEIQALVGDSTSTHPQRTAVGVDANRVILLQAVIEKHLGEIFGGLDVYLNVAGGLRLGEPALDAAVAAAMLSSFRNKPLPSDTVVFGEIGLTGEVRGVTGMGERVAEAARMGFRRAVMPEPVPGAMIALPEGMQMDTVSDLKSLAEALFD